MVDDVETGAGDLIQILPMGLSWRNDAEDHWVAETSGTRYEHLALTFCYARGAWHWSVRERDGGKAVDNGQDLLLRRCVRQAENAAAAALSAGTEP